MLDPQGRDEVIQVVDELKRKTGLTVISITHDLEEVLLADRVIVMNNGKMMMSGKPEEIFAHGDELEAIGLDLPFACKNIPIPFARTGIAIQGEHMTEEELVNELWTSHFSK